jgi:hypothetical protein
MVGNNFEVLCAFLTHFVSIVKIIGTETYHMLATCDPAIASWSDGGDSFIIKDVKEFSKVRMMLYVYVSP